MLLDGVWLITSRLLAEKEYDYVHKVYAGSPKEAMEISEIYFKDKEIQTVHAIPTQLSIDEWKLIGRIKTINKNE